MKTEKLRSWARKVLRVLRPEPASAEDEAAFDRHLQATVALYSRACAITLNVLQLLWWPTDPFVLPPGPIFSSMRWFRATTLVNHSLFIVAVSIPALRRYTLWLFVLATAVSSALLGTTFGRMGGLDHPYFHVVDLVPMIAAAVPLRLGPRIALTALPGAVVPLSYLRARPDQLWSPHLGPTLGAMLFAVLVSIAYGHLLFLLTRRAFLQERALARSATALQEHSTQLEGLVAQQTQHLRRLAAHLTSAAEDERVRIAGELHDELGQQVTAMRYTLAFVRQRLRREPERAETQVSQVEEILTQFAATVRHLVSELRPRILDDRGLHAAAHWLVQRTRQHSGLPVELVAHIDDSVAIPPPLATAAFRILQEALTNAVRHAGATLLRVELTARPDGLLLLIVDDGRGLPAPAPAQVHAGMGLLGMRERARAHGGQLDLHGGPGGGTVVRAWLPLAGPEPTGGVP